MFQIITKVVKCSTKTEGKIPESLCTINVKVIIGTYGPQCAGTLTMPRIHAGRVLNNVWTLKSDML